MDEVERWLLAAGFGVARTLPIVWIIPGFGGPSVPRTVRVGLALAFSGLCLPSILGHLPPAPSGALLWALLLAREVAVGATVGFLGSCVFQGAEAAGRLVDILRGANLAEVISPTSGERTSPLGQISLMVATLIFFELGGPGYMATALARSYDAVPLAPALGSQRLAGTVGLALIASGRIFESALLLAAPAVVALLLADVALGAVGKFAPQIPLYFVAMPLKALGGVAAVLLGLAVVRSTLVAAFGGWPLLIERAFALWR